jgi:hypothetical protein
MEFDADNVGINLGFEHVTCEDSSSVGEFSDLASGFGVTDPLIDLAPMLDLSSEDAISTILDTGL